MSHEPARDLAEIRSMMERSTKFLSLSGWAGILVGLYALAGVWAAYRWFGFHPISIRYSSDALTEVIGLAVFILVLAIATAMLLSGKQQAKKGEKGFTPASRQLLAALMVPLAVGGLLIMVLVWHGLVGLAAPLMLLFYGLSLHGASRFTFEVVRVLGWIQIALGLAASVWIMHGLWFWAVGFGLAHILYGIYVHLKVER
jgi:hypothetical protein